MLQLVTGPPGTGKTYRSVRKHLEALQSGHYVATNVRLHDGWAESFARENYIDRFLELFVKGKPRIHRKAVQYEERTFISGDLDELFALRLPKCEKCKGCKQHKSCQREGRGLMILDEAHEWLNARMWDIDHTGLKLSRDEAVQNRLKVVKFFALHRKLGWNVDLVTQSEKRLDNQVRDNFEYHTHLKNMRKFKIWGLFPVVPFNWFWAITDWHASGGERVGIKSYLLIKRIADQYDTMARPELPHGARELGVIMLPLSDEDRRARAEGRWTLPSAEDETVTAPAPVRNGERRGAPARSAAPPPPPARPARPPLAPEPRSESPAAKATAHIPDGTVPLPDFRPQEDWVE
jgi:hypothetical protein